MHASLRYASGEGPGFRHTTYQRDSGLAQDKDSGLLTMMLPSCTTTFFDALGLGGMEVDLRRNLLLMDLDDSYVWMDDLDEVSLPLNAVLILQNSSYL